MRGRAKNFQQSERLLTLLLHGNVVTVSEIEEAIGNQLPVYRLSGYLWDLKRKGAKIIRRKHNRKIITLQLLNHEAMKTYLLKHKLISEGVLSESDLMVGVG